MQRYSKNREAILACLRGTKSHPTADWIYAQLKPDYPDLSLATVYRNLAALKDSGAIRSVGIVNGQERFDAVTGPHPHAVCSRCGAIIDLSGVPVPRELIDAVQAETGFAVSEAVLQFTGLCPECREKENQTSTKKEDV